MSALLNSCRPSFLITEEYEKIDYDEIYLHFTKLHTKIDTYSVRRVSLRYTEGNHTQNLRGSIRGKKDSVIIMNVNVIAGIEAARVKFTPDSIHIIDRINREFFSDSYEKAGSVFPVQLNFFELQSVLLGSPVKLQAFLKGKDSKETINYYHTDENILLKYYEIDKHNNYNANKYEIKLVLNRALLPESLSIIDIANAWEYSVNYKNYENINGEVLPREFDITQKRGDYISVMQFNFSGIEINRDLNFSFRIPSNYEEM